MPPVGNRVDVVIYRDPGAYIAHPCIARLDNGDLLVAFNESLPRQPWLHPPYDPRFMSLVSRSTDAGSTWQAPRAAPNYSMTGVECPSIVQIDTGEVMLVQWKFAWYTLEAARKAWRASPSETQFVLPSRRSWMGYRVTSEAHWDAAEYPWVRADGGVFVSLSSDFGATWDSTHQVAVAPFSRGYSPRPPCQLADGTLVLALDSHDERGALYVLRSSDRGRTWSPPTTVSDGSPLAEPTIVALASGRVIVLSRDEKTCLLHQHVSDDGGYTWSAPRTTDIWGYPAHALQMDDGRLLVVYGVRRPAYGIRACLSVDNGETWEYSDELIIRDDMPNRNLGYPTVIQRPDGRIMTAYYGEDATGVTHVIGSTFSLP